MKKNFFYTFCLSSLTLSNFIQAETNNTSTPQSSSSDYRMITPVASPIIKDGVKFEINADFIYWRAGQTNLTVAEYFPVNTNVFATDNQTIPQGNPISLKTKYSPGFKVGCGLGFDHDGWDLFAEYTWFRSHSKDVFYQDNPIVGALAEVPTTLLNLQNFIENNPFFDSQIAVRTFKPDWKFNFNNIDLELGRNFYVSHYLTLRPYIGLKGGWQKQLWDSKWTFSNTNLDPERLPHRKSYFWTNANYDIFMKNTLWNIGLRGGFDTTWFIDKHWAFVGNLAFSNVWTYLTALRIDTASTSGSSHPEENVSNFQTNNALGKISDLNNVTEIKLGLLYDVWFEEESYRLRFETAWETQLWGNFPNFFTGSSKNIASFNGQVITPNLQGLTVKVQLDF